MKTTRSGHLPSARSPRRVCPMRSMLQVCVVATLLCLVTASSSLAAEYGSDQPGEVGLVLRRVDVRVLVVLEHPEEAVQPDVHARRLHHRLVEGVQGDALGVDLAEDVAVGEQHERDPTGPSAAGQATRDPSIPA